MTENISVFLAFSAGLLSFLSPCVLPLVPSYFGILAGVGLDIKGKPLLLWTSFGFIMGFSAVFVLLGILLNSIFFLMGNVVFYINIAAGIIVIILGFNIIFNFIPFLNYEKRPFLRTGPKTNDSNDRPGLLRGMIAAFLGGAAFAAGWTPCIGPVLTGILLLAGQSGKTGIAVFYLCVYSAGMGIPFFLCALFFNLFLKAGARIKSYLPLIQRISGILLIVIGVMILTGNYSALNVHLQKLFPG